MSPVAFSGPAIGPVPVEFILFASVLIGVAVFHHHTLRVAVYGAIVIALYKILFSPFKAGAGLAGFGSHLLHEWVILINLLLLLLGFALLAKHFEDTEIPAVLPRWLPDDWKGCFVLLVLVFVLSSFLDNIAAAMIGGAIAHTVFRGKVHIGYLAAIVAASNGGGSGSVVGDTTTTMMWIAGVHPLEVLEAFIGACVALVLFGIPASLQQQRFSPIQKDETAHQPVDWTRVGIVAFILISAIAVNVVVNVRFNEVSDLFPFLGAAVWVALLLSVGPRRPDWNLFLPGAFKGSVFLLSLVLCASMMPVERLPAASWQTAFGLGFLSSVFDNIPLTALSIKQGGYDWGFLADAVGFGGSMIWFGSSAGVALCGMYPQGRNVAQWLRHGWHVAVAYVVGFLVMLATIGFHPDVAPRGSAAPAAASPR
ncbi:MAG TPA: SLC13 family permease [Burkholderiaceae bacterium]|nr:SLC13 family permease [Burkholderiaceae bacterium]HSC00158.1 SLC13 family permease [Burkholderiaceae bacterium]